MKAAVIGLGSMGSGIAKSLLRAGVETVGYDTDETARQALVASGGTEINELDALPADCDIALRLTAFELVNGENEGEYHQIGLAGTGRYTLCAAEDDIFRAFGDPQETLVATALDWFGSGACPTATAADGPQPMAQRHSKLPPWLPVEYIPERIDSNLR